MRDLLEKKIIEIHRCSIKETLGDILTKSLAKEKFEELAEDKDCASLSILKKEKC